MALSRLRAGFDSQIGKLRFDLYDIILSYKYIYTTMSLSPDSRSKRKRPLVTDSSDLPSVDFQQQFGRRDLEGLSARERTEKLLEERRSALIEKKKTRKRLNDQTAKTRKNYETKRGMFQSANEIKATIEKGRRRRAERERASREAMEREERRTRINMNAERAEKLFEERRANALRLQEEVPRETNNVEVLPLQQEEDNEGEHSIMTRFPTGWVMTRSPDEMLEGLYQERQRNAAVAARMARDNEILMTTDEWKRAKERAEEAFNERRRSAVRERASTPISSSSSSSVPKKIKKGYKYEEVPVETPEIETSRSRRRRERDARIEDAEMEAAIKAVADEEADEALREVREILRRNRGGKRKTRRVRKSKKMKKRIKRRKSRK